jgi:hypothetical protein
MSTYHQVFIRTALPAERFLADIEAATHSPVEPVPDEVNKDIDYASQTGTAFVDIHLSHDFVATDEIDVSKYSFYLEVRDRDSDLDRQKATALSIFNTLKNANGQYSMMLLLEGQTLLEKC